MFGFERDQGRVSREPLVTVTRLQWVIIVSNYANYTLIVDHICWISLSAIMWVVDNWRWFVDAC